jgi:DNA (cytosine-5)-methyltransferase 1
MVAYYNEIDAHAADWLEKLIAGGLIPDGVVDRRSIVDVQPDDLEGFAACHFFAGIGGLPLALRLAGWPDDREIWTGSCPCGPFSRAGKKQGFADPRHLWPAWECLIRVRRPAAIVGEQSADATEWIRLVRGDLVAMDYAVGIQPFEAASAGSQHRRERVYFLADRDHQRRGFEQQLALREAARARDQPDGRRQGLVVGNAPGDGKRRPRKSVGTGAVAPGGPGAGGGMAGDGPIWVTDTHGKSRLAQSGIRGLVDGVSGRVAVRRAVERAGAETVETHTYNRVGALKGLGNAVDIRAARAWVESVMEVLAPMLAWLAALGLLAAATLGGRGG